METVVERFKQTHYRLNGGSLGLLNELYDDDVSFEDPFHRIAGLPQLTAYFESLYRHVTSCSFVFHDEAATQDQAFLTWTMSWVHPRLNGGRLVTVPGSTHIRFREKVWYHRDYFDTGAMLYEQLPVIRSIIRAIKARI